MLSIMLSKFVGFRAKIKRQTSGFTLIEMIVSISIIALISGIFLANYHPADKRNNLGMAAQKLASDIRLAQNHALSQQEYGPADESYGWGVYFSSVQNTKYIIYIDSDNNKQYNTPFEDPNEKYREIVLPSGITVSLIDIDNHVSIHFVPPDPDTYFNGLQTNNQVVITLTEASTGASATITVNLLGLIDVN